MAVRRLDNKYILVLAFVSGAILALGYLIRPPGPQGEAAPVAADLLQLERITQRRNVELLADYFDSVATQVEPSVVLLSASQRTGIIWQAGEVVTAAGLGPFLESDRTALATREVELETLVESADLPIVTLRAPLAAPVGGRGQARLYRRGSWLLAIWRTPAGGLRYQPGNLFGVAAQRCAGLDVDEIQTNLDLGTVSLGAGIFSLDAGLVGIVLDCDGVRIVADSTSLETLVHREQSIETRVLERFGMRVSSLAMDEQAFFGVGEGAVVLETWWGYGAHQAGLFPGDVILSLDGHAVAGPNDLESAVLPVSREVLSLRIRRAGRRRSVDLPARRATSASLSGYGFVQTGNGPRIDAVPAGSLAEQAGARPGDRVLAMNQRPLGSVQELEQALEQGAGRGVFLTLERQGRMWGVLVGGDE